MIRLVLILILVVIFLIISLPIQLVVWLLSKKWPKAPDHVSYPLVLTMFRVIMFVAGVKLTVIGEENVPKDTAVMYAANHRGFFDIISTYTRVPRPTGYLAKKELKKVPGLNIWMSLMHCVFLDRDDIKQGLQCILKCIDLINNGISVTVFPEGTRNKVNDTFLPFHEASFKIAQKTKCPIVPIAINNSAAILEDHMPRIKPTHLIIEYLEPIYIDELEPEDKKKLGAYTQAKIEEAYFKNKEIYGL